MQSTTTAPNILFVTVDQWPGHLLGCAGHPTIETPTLDQLARIGTRYENAYSECPICIPARRSIMTGTSPRRHGDRDFQPDLPMPADLPTLGQTFRDAGYQTQAIGKLHVYPQRDRIGFEDAMLAEEGRGALGSTDDYEMFLADSGHAGQQFMHGMSNNEYGWRTWHLPEELHVTNWTTFTAARSIQRRDPTRPGLWHVSYTHPHPPLVPLASYVERYRDRMVPPPVMGDWASNPDALPQALRATRAYWPQLPKEQLADVRRAFYALCTHIDHQLRVLIGTLREQQILSNTIILITSDHGDMLGDHGLYAKRLMFDPSAKVPMILVSAAGDGRASGGTVDDRLVGMQDIMPTLLDLCGLPIPETCEGRSMVGDSRRETFYAETLSGAKAMRMVRDRRYKLIWYPGGNRFQLFDLEADPQELRDLSQDPLHRATFDHLESCLVAELYGQDLDFTRDGRLVGCPPDETPPPANRGLSGQRGLHYPAPPIQDPSIIAGGAL
ncbi:arylsulfatase [Aureimonas altamirensis]|uniref:Arylsulfatase n=1 Tax=Aureimonas altamirensis TaxID=370622 RepID=A0A0B1Q3H9_9HYPH|nr:sulfatase-like hydrolase/transferase [Aureimonas altamirensis]KHJ55413.1 arylsulfatase [Aureimonas altamirensis]